MQKIKNEFCLSDDKALLKIPEIHLLLKRSYWAYDYSQEKIERLVHNSLCLGLYLEGGLLGFARIVTDRSTVSLITDFIIHEDYRDQKLGTWLMEFLLEHPDLKETSMSLGTHGANRFFNKFDFREDGSLMLRWPMPPRQPPAPTRPVGFKPKGASWRPTVASNL
jgi:GNAT superfamily N-acetyltransferase